MRLFLASLVTMLVATAGGIAYAGFELGGVFAVVCLVALIAPVFASTTDFRVLPSIAVFAGAAVASLLLPAREALDWPQWFLLLAVLAAFTFALAGCTRLLICCRLAPAVAGLIVMAAALAWLSWPIWVSPWVTQEHADLVSPWHPLLAVNGAVPQYGLWQQSRLMYSLTSLGQDVSAGPPETVWPATVFHAALAAVAFIPPAGLWLLRRRRAAAAG